LQEEVDRLKAEKRSLEEQVLEIEGQYVRIKNKIFGKSSEKSPSPEPPQNTESDDEKKNKGKKENKENKNEEGGASKRPSGRYKNAEIIEKELEFETLPSCRSCGLDMVDSGMCEVSEYLTVTPKKYSIIRQIRHKYRCQCHGDIQTAPCLPRIKPGSAYGDEMIIDIAASKYCDLIPIERYCAMAARQGFEGLPANSLIETTHYLADFVSEAVECVRQEVLGLEIIYADETTHRMLEGDEKSNWYLWGFAGKNSCYFECHDTRSGDVASSLLIKSQCRVLVSDVYSGYNKAVRETNEIRELFKLPLIQNAFCNAHARRNFKEAKDLFFNEAKYYIEKYKEIYRLEGEVKDRTAEEILVQRKRMSQIFEEMKKKAEEELNSYSTKSLMFKALNYFLKNYLGLTLFLSHAEVPIDNNAQERNLRSPVVGRKTWLGTHSKRGSETAAKLFTLVESCKLNDINPRVYLSELVATLHARGAPFSPKTFKERKLIDPSL
jgi:transposase